MPSKISHLDSNPQYVPGKSGSFFKMDLTRLATGTYKPDIVPNSARNLSASRNSGRNMFQKAGQMILPVSDNS